MKIRPTIACALITQIAVAFAQSPTIENPLIDYEGFKQIVIRQENVREQMRLTEVEFLKAAQSGEYILLDARSAANFKQRHIQGAINLPFTEFDAGSLAQIIPDTNSKILIYCNNNFLNSPQALTAKSLVASLNVNTQASLRAYGYSQIYELGPAVDLKTTLLPMAGSLEADG